jgi:replication fork protection complex subunit Tof1/Swi1
MASSRPRASSYDSIASAIPDIDLDDPHQRAQVYYPAVQSLTNALGGYEEQETSPGSGTYETVYRPGDSILAVLKDLKKLWRKDDSDDERTVARCMYRSGLMKELISILVGMTERGDWGKKVALVACELFCCEVCKTRS